MLKLRRYDEVIRSCDAALATGKKSAVLYEFRGLAHAAPSRLSRARSGITARPWRFAPMTAGCWPAAAGRTWSSTRPNWPWPTSKRRSSSIRPMATPTTAAARPARGCGDHVAAVADAREALRHGRTNPRVTYNAARIYALAASVAAAEVGEKGRQARPLAAEYQDIAVQLIREAFEREAPEKRSGLLAGDDPGRPGLEGDPAAAQVRGIDRDQQVAELVND